MTTDITVLAGIAHDAAAHHTDMSRRATVLTHELQTRTLDITDVAKGRGIDGSAELLVRSRQSGDAGALAHAEIADGFSDLERAAQNWVRSAPTDEELEAAGKAYRDAKAALSDVSDADGSAAKRAFDDAQTRLHYLRLQREDADKAFREACERLQDKLAKRQLIKEKSRSVDVHGGHSGMHLGGTPAPKAPAVPAKPAPAPAPSAHTPPTPAPSAAVPAPAPSTAPAATTSDAVKDPTAFLNLLREQEAVKAAAQQPTVAPTGAPRLGGGGPQLGGQAPKNDKARDRPIDVSDVANLVGSGGVAVPATLAALAPTQPQAPVTTATTAAAPAPEVPVTGGVSATGLRTDADISGRTDPPRGPFDGSRTTLSSSTNPGTGGGSVGQGAGTGTQPGSGAGQPSMVPPVGGLGGGAGSGSPRKPAPIEKYTSDEAVLNGAITQSEAVRGGTIAQRRPRE